MYNYVYRLYVFGLSWSIKVLKQTPLPQNSKVERGREPINEIVFMFSRFICEKASIH